MTLRQRVLRLLPPALTGQLRTWRVRRLIAAFEPRTVEHVFGSGTLRVRLADPLGQGWYDHDWVQAPEIPALRGTSLRPGARVFNIGAHQGVVAMMFAREVGPSGQVVAVEPNPHNAACARENAALNGMSQIVVVEGAVTDRPGTVVFNAGMNGQLDDGTGAGGRMRVTALTIDALAERFGLPDLVTLDVEGAECLALGGARRVLASGADFSVEAHVNVGLEKLGGSVARLLASFPPEHFSVSVRSEADEQFRSLRPDDTILSDRFFLLAQSNRRDIKVR